jgi:hypothetical protein
LVEAEGIGSTQVETPSERALLELAAKLAAVTAVALPVCGFLTRSIAFLLCGRIGSPGWMHLAAAQSLGDLTVVGIVPALFALPAYVGGLFQVRRLARPSKHRHHRHIKLFWVRIVSLLAIAVGLFLILVAMFLTGPFLTGLFVPTLLTVTLVWLVLIYRKHGSLHVWWTWPILICCLLAGTILSALQYRDVPVAEYTLDPTAGVPSGLYLELGRSDGIVYLLSCTDTNASVVGVPPGSIYRAQYARRTSQPTSPSLLDLLTGKAATPLGLQTQCAPKSE